MADVQVTDKAKEELTGILDKNAGKFLRMFIEGFG